MKRNQREQQQQQPKGNGNNKLVAIATGCHDKYDWQSHFSFQNGGFLAFLRYLASGRSNRLQTALELHENLCRMARLLVLLRRYMEFFGLPDPTELMLRREVIRDITRIQYSSGTPIWALEPLMTQVLHSLTGLKTGDCFILPRKAIVFGTGRTLSNNVDQVRITLGSQTIMFPMTRGVDIQVYSMLQPILVRILSYRSNTDSVAVSNPSRHQICMEDLAAAYHAAAAKPGLVDSTLHTTANRQEDPEMDPDADALAQEILSLASQAGFLFYKDEIENAIRGSSQKDEDSGKSFWDVEHSLTLLFCHLVTKETSVALSRVRAKKKVLYNKALQFVFRFVSSAGTCAFWFEGSWIDILVAGCLGMMVAAIGQAPFFTRDERRIFEVSASLVVGLVAGLIVGRWSDKLCWSAISTASIIDIVQGYRIVFSAIEIMTKNTVSGTADFIEGILYSAIIAFALVLGLNIAVLIDGNVNDIDSIYFDCQNPVPTWSYFVFVPLSSLSWAGMFNPYYKDLPVMATFGIVSYVVNWALSRTGLEAIHVNFLTALAVTFISGVAARFTGRQSVGNAMTGLYVLVPGSYAITSLVSRQAGTDFVVDILSRATVIGLGAWMGSMLCSPIVSGVSSDTLTR